VVRDDEQMEEDLLAAQRVKILEDRSTRLVEREKLSLEDGGGREGELVKERLVGEETQTAQRTAERRGAGNHRKSANISQSVTVTPVTPPKYGV